VFVATRPGVELTAQQVQAIVHLVSASIPDMTNDGVTVVDATGRVLSANGGAGIGSSDQATSEYEARVSSALQGMLDTIFGRGKAVVAVTAELNYDVTQSTSETFDYTPGTPPLTSSTTTEDYTSTGGTTATGVLGPDNIQVPNGNAVGGDSTYAATSEDVQNAVNKNTTITQSAPGSTVTRQSVAVMIDATAAGTVADLNQLQATLAAAAGIDTNRGDTIALQTVQFDQSAANAAQAALDDAAAAEQAAAQAAQMDKYIQYGIAGLLFLGLIVFLLVRKASKNRKERREAIHIGDLDDAGDDPLLLDGGEALDLPELQELVQPMRAADRKRAELTELADKEPEVVAELLRGYLAGAGMRRGR
jgi:flagellar M-ring protein FliF